MSDEESISGWTVFGLFLAGCLVFSLVKSGWDYLMSSQGSPIRGSLELLLLGGIGLGMLIWQFVLIREDDGIPARLVVPWVVCLVMLVGVLIRGGMRISDGHVMKYGFKTLFGEIAAVLVISVILTFKTYLGPIFLGTTLIQLVYNGFELKHVFAIRLAYALIEAIVPGLPSGAEMTYTIVAVVTAFGACTWESVTDLL